MLVNTFRESDTVTGIYRKKVHETIEGVTFALLTTKRNWGGRGIIWVRAHFVVIYPKGSDTQYM